MQNYIKARKTVKFLFWEIKTGELSYLYLDTKDYLANSLFYKRNIPVKVVDNFINKKEKYIFLLCRVKSKYEKQVEEALEELKKKMSLCGYLDYEEKCKEIITKINETRKKNGKTTM